MMHNIVEKTKQIGGRGRETQIGGQGRRPGAGKHKYPISTEINF